VHLHSRSSLSSTVPTRVVSLLSLARYDATLPQLEVGSTTREIGSAKLLTLETGHAAERTRKSHSSAAPLGPCLSLYNGFWHPTLFCCVWSDQRCCVITQPMFFTFFCRESMKLGTNSIPLTHSNPLQVPDSKEDGHSSSGKVGSSRASGTASLQASAETNALAESSSPLGREHSAGRASWEGRPGSAGRPPLPPSQRPSPQHPLDSQASSPPQANGALSKQVQ